MLKTYVPFLITLVLSTIVSQGCATAQNATALNEQHKRLAATWRHESSALSHYKKIVLTLRSDGTYTKTLIARSSQYSGGYTGTGPTMGGTHSGTWSAQGTLVRLSGDGNWPATTHDVREFSRD
jgi:hypothetical protein